MCLLPVCWYKSISVKVYRYNNFRKYKMSVTNSNQFQPVLAGFGNPLLDVCIKLQDMSIYKKYDLEIDGQKEVTVSELFAIQNNFKTAFNFSYHAGGCAQNTLRIVQRLIKKPNKSVIFGGIGCDEHSTILKREVESYGVITRYALKPDFATGTCISLINGVHRSLVAHLGAADIYCPADFLSPENIELFKTIQIVYIEGFFITHSFKTALEVVKLCKTSGILIAFNICGVYLFENHFYKEILHMIQNSDIVFGNASEYKKFWEYYSEKHLNLKEVLVEIQQHVMVREKVELPPLRHKMFLDRNTTKMVICTQGSDSVICIHGEMESLEEYPPRIDEENIIDTTGGGDSFVGGFLAGLLQHKDVRHSIKDGCWVASKVIQQYGCNF